MRLVALGQWNPGLTALHAAGLWQTFKVAGLEAQCLEMDASSKAVSNADCSQDASVLPSQQFRLFSATPNARDPSATAIGALEPAVAPGICVFNTPANGILARCSCEALALVRRPHVCRPHCSPCTSRQACCVF